MMISRKTINLKSLIFVLLTISLLSCTQKELEIEKATKKIDLTFNSYSNLHTRSGREENENKLISIIELNKKEVSEDTLNYYFQVFSKEQKSVIVNHTNQTRAAKVNNISGLDFVGLFASRYSSSETWGANKSLNYIFNLKLDPKTQNPCNTGYFWTGRNEKLSFFAYAPYNATGLQLPSNTTVGDPIITFTSNENVTQQHDLLVGNLKDIAGNTNSTITMHLKHALTALTFNIGGSSATSGGDFPMLPGTIKKITIKNIYKTAKYNLNTDTWSDYSNKGDLVINMSLKQDGSEGTIVTNGANTFMLIPQPVNEDVVITVNFNDDLSDAHTPRVLTATLGTNNNVTTLPKGKHLIFNICNSGIYIEPVLKLTHKKIVSPEGGITAKYEITSILKVIQKGDTTVLDVPWETEHSEDGGTTWTDGYPDWLNDFTSSSTGGEKEEFTVEVAPRIADIVNPATDILRSNPLNDNYNVCHPSGAGSVAQSSTANCYIIHAANNRPYWLLPFYGNSLKNGKINKVAYDPANRTRYNGSYQVLNANYLSTTQSDYNKATPTFKDHRGNIITRPEIWEQCKDLFDAGRVEGCLIWQDAKDLVTNVYMDSPGGIPLLFFNISQATIQEGNAVIGLRDKQTGDILWSWHIWVTPYHYEDDSELISLTNKEGNSFNMMKRNVGFCVGDTTKYEPRDSQIKFKVTDPKYKDIMASEMAKENNILEIQQTKKYEIRNRRNVYYQWGRKDPMVPTMSTNPLVPAPCYTQYPQYKYRVEIQGIPFVSTQKMIATPNVFYCANQYAICAFTDADIMRNYWNATDTRSYAMEDALSVVPNCNKVVKTIYDPSPLGFTVPQANTYTNAALSGGARNGYITNEGVAFYCNGTSGPTYEVFCMGAIGSRDGSRGFRRNTLPVNTWRVRLFLLTAGGGDANRSAQFTSWRYKNTQTVPLYGKAGTKTNGASLMPIKEKN